MQLRKGPWFIAGVLSILFVAKGTVTYVHAEGGSSAQTSALPKPTNLKVLPKASSLPDVYTAWPRCRKILE